MADGRERLGPFLAGARVLRVLLTCAAVFVRPFHHVDERDLLLVDVVNLGPLERPTHPQGFRRGRRWLVRRHVPVVRFAPEALRFLQRTRRTERQSATAAADFIHPRNLRDGTLEAHRAHQRGGPLGDDGFLADCHGATTGSHRVTTGRRRVVLGVASTVRTDRLSYPHRWDGCPREGHRFRRRKHRCGRRTVVVLLVLLTTAKVVGITIGRIWLLLLLVLVLLLLLLLLGVVRGDTGLYLAQHLTVDANGGGSRWRHLLGRLQLQQIVVAFGAQHRLPLVLGLGLLVRVVLQRGEPLVLPDVAAPGHPRRAAAQLPEVVCRLQLIVYLPTPRLAASLVLLLLVVVMMVVVRWRRSHLLVVPSSERQLRAVLLRRAGMIRERTVRPASVLQLVGAATTAIVVTTAID
uniref:Uncharacterized protein n=1 Tax=Anopheles atroparvus TaxID=41427 RepID=A0AAG5DXB6_ANOAO